MTSLQKLRIAETVMVSIIAGMGAEPIISLQAKYITEPHPGLMSVLMVIGSMLATQQVLCNKIPKGMSLYVPFAADITLQVVALVMYIIGRYDYLVLLECGIGAVISILFMNRRNILVENVSSDRTYLNLIGSTFGVGNLVGSGVAAILLQFIRPIDMWAVCFSLQLAILPIHFMVNKGVLETIKE